MRVLSICLALLVTIGCTSKTVEVTCIRVRPVELLVAVEDAKPEFDSAPYRYMTRLRVLEPAVRKGSELHLLVDGVTADRVAFVVPGSRWKIACDEEAFEHERKIGFSFWSYTDLRPEGRPNQPPEPTAMSVTPPAAQESRQP